MQEKFLQNLFFEIKKYLNLKSYLFTVFLFVAYTGINGVFLKYLENNFGFYYTGNYSFYSEKFVIVIFLILIYKVIFKEKILLNGKNIGKFLLNNIVILGILIYLSGYINKIVNSLEQDGYLSYTLFQLNLLKFFLQLKESFVMLVIFSGVLVFIGRKNISIFEGIEIFCKSIGKFFTLIFFWLFTLMFSHLSYYMRNFNDYISDRFLINKVLFVIDLLIKSYFIHVCFIIALVIFKNYFVKNIENNEVENLEAENVTALAFENTFEILKKFYGKICGVYILAGIIGIGLGVAVAQVFSSLILAFIFIIGITNLVEIFVIKTCFKFMNISTEKLNFSKFIKIYGGTIFLLIVNFIVISMIFMIIKTERVMIYLDFYENVRVNLKNFIITIISLFSFYFIFVAHSFQVMFILKESEINEKKESSLKNGLQFMSKIFSWKFAVIVAGINLLRIYATKSIENFKTYLQFYPDTTPFLTNLIVSLFTLFIIFLITQSFLLFIVNYFIEKVKLK